MNQQPQGQNDSSSILNQGMQNVSDAYKNVKTSITDNINSFSNQPNATSEFKFSNTIVAKFAFLILVIIVFVFFVNLGIILISYFRSPKSNPYLVKGMSAGNSPLVINQNPSSSGSVTLLRSNNKSNGAEFTWSIWLYIDDLDINTTIYHNIFNKGDNTYDVQTGISAVNNGPGLYLGNGGDKSKPINTLHIIMDVVGDTVSTNEAVTNNPQSTNAKRVSSFVMSEPAIIDIPNVPLKKWFHVAIRLENTILDAYINGTIDQRVILKNVPKQNYNDVNICQNGGFSGSISDLRYFNTALNVFQINTIIGKGPNMKTSYNTIQNQSMSNYNYLSYLWYSDN
jgi:hypothetical protein